MAQDNHPEKRVGGILQMGYGTWNHPGEEAYNGVLWALEAGYRHIDTAQGYDNEEEVGKAIADSGVPRADIHVTTKVKPENFAPGVVLSSTKVSLEKLGVGPVDLLLLHYPSIDDEYEMEEYMGQLAQLYDDGSAKTIGLSNFTIKQIDKAKQLLGDRKIATNQVEAHVYMQNAPIVNHCRDLGIPITAFSPLARGAVVGDPLLEEIGAAHNATGPQVAIAFLMAEGHIVIPSSAKKERIISNFAAGAIELSAAEVERIRGLEKNMRLVNGSWCPKWDV